MTVHELARTLNKDEPLKHAVVITFDDGLKNVLRASEIMAEYGFTGTLSVVTSTIGGEVFINKTETKPVMTLQELHQLEQRGWEIVSHTHDLHHLGQHDLHTIQGGDRREYLRTLAIDLTRSRQFLQQHFPSQPNNILVWPFNFKDQDSVAEANAVGFTTLLTTDVHHLDSFEKTLAHQPLRVVHIGELFSGHATKVTSLNFVPRIEISAQTNLAEFKKRVGHPAYLFFRKVFS